VLSVTDYGAFVELEQGIEGLVHVSEMTWSKRMKHPSKLVKPGDESRYHHPQWSTRTTGASRWA